jgi:hypothetical protein
VEVSELRSIVCLNRLFGPANIVQIVVMGIEESSSFKGHVLGKINVV